MPGRLTLEVMVCNSPKIGMVEINEIFHSIQGESTLAGLPTVFVRTSRCNLRCSYCDTQYAYKSAPKIPIPTIIDQIKTYDCQYVCITGGEPLLQKGVPRLSEELCELGFRVSIETNGSISAVDLDERVKKIFDVKTPESGAANSFEFLNLTNLQPHDEFKFVISSANDFIWAEKFVKEYLQNCGCEVLYSPSFGLVEEKWLAKMILLNKSSARLQLQLHKYIWDKDQRGV
jgi:7-carboxy-7-deazaguanine synthase